MARSAEEDVLCTGDVLYLRWHPARASSVIPRWHGKIATVWIDWFSPSLTEGIDALTDITAQESCRP